MHDIAQKQIFFFKLPELDPDPDLVVNFPDPDPAKRSGSDRIRNTDSNSKFYPRITLFLKDGSQRP
jgi:hypothetical protein